MEIIKYPGREEWSSLIKRPALDVTTLFDTVRTVLDEVREQGDIAVKAYEEKFDKVLLSSHGIDVGSARTYRRLQGDRIMYATEPGRESTSRYPVRRRGRRCK